jgi:predicted regulator of Ras-like GTPase activity (Roadblock/LC7/MglB family)
VNAAARRAVHADLVSLTTSVAHVTGAVLASVDGLVVAAALSDADADPDATAAIVASSKGLGDRLAELAGADGTLQEIVVRSSSGYVVIYTTGDHGVLTVLTRPEVNLALLHHHAREAATALAGAVGRPSRARSRRPKSRTEST